MDVTELQRANAALEETRSEAEEARALLHDALDSSTDGFAIFDADERLVLYNKSWAYLNRESADLLDKGVTFEELLRSRAAKGLVPDIGDDAEEWLSRRIDQFRNAKEPIERVYPDGSWWQVNDQRMSVGGIAEVATNITQLKKREAELLESEERFRTTFEDTAVGASIVGPDFKYRITNKAFLDMVGYTMEELRELTPMDITRPEDRAADIKNLNAFNAGETDAVYLEKCYIRKDGSELWATVSASVVRDPDGQTLYSIRHVQDITERMRAEQSMQKLQGELAHVSRVSTMGEMAAGFAHELNQPLAAIANYAQGTLRRYRSGAIEMADFARVLELVVEQTHRAGDIIRKIRQFIQKEEPERRDINVNAAIREATELVQSEALQCDAVIELDLEEALPLVSADLVQLQQVLLNLARNGLEAMRETVDGNRLLSIRTASFDATNVEIVVEDSGPGIPEAIHKKLFDPFFTTKSEGMGMGLSICHSIVEAHGGGLKVVKNKMGGAAFRIILPVAK
ncbi:MAG: PAS domain S-box protein [Rhodospirillales bacterium]|nr:PAS domain S-box protein [Rhodospirillales bacterium]